MQTEQVHTVILGAGPAGLAAGYTLARANLRPLILEKDKVCGGLMRSIRRGDFIVDVGRKELYNRLDKVDAFWSDLIGDDYRRYPHRGGILYDGHIIETSPEYCGFRRNLPWTIFLACCIEFARCQLKRPAAHAQTLQEYWYQRRGRRLTQIFSQGFQEKLHGTKWNEIQLTPTVTNEKKGGLLRTFIDAGLRTFSRKEANTHLGVWRHPARGTGQICEELESHIRDLGGTIRTEVDLREIAVSNDKIKRVVAEIGGKVFGFEPEHVVSSIPIEYLMRMLFKRSRSDTLGVSQSSSLFREKTVVLVYLFLNEEPRFPHAWLNVTCPDTKLGRITNYAALNGSMVPKGKTALCCEFYCFDNDKLLQADDAEIAQLALDECARAGIVHPDECFDRMVIRFRGADASQNRSNWLSKDRLKLLAQLNQFQNLYYVSRTDLDIATLAGIEAAEAILSRDRSTFDQHIDPTRIGIRSERKRFEFKNPVESESMAS